MTETLSERDREVLEHLEQAQSSGCTLREYAEAAGIDVKALYHRGAQLRRKGVLASKVPSAPTTDGDFITVRMAETAAQVTRPTGTVCRILHAGGHVIECTEWPAASWISALLAGTTDAAA